jgi:NAD(P)-dependent dehydrogenase (short-subunit alcohol dehydrogenase family)
MATAGHRAHARALLVIVVVAAFGRGAAGQLPVADPLTGRWGIGPQTVLDITVDATGRVTGTAFFAGGGAVTALPIRTGTFDTATRALKLEGDVTLPGAAASGVWTIEGVLDGDSLRLAFALGAVKGPLLLTRLRTPAAETAPQGRAADRTVLITGSNRGLGLEFVRQYAAAGWNVVATVRDPGGADELRALAAGNSRVTIETLDLRDLPGIKALAARHAGRPIDVLLNNGGVLGDMSAQQLGALDYAQFEDVMAVNVFGALAVAEAFREHVAASREKKIVSVTSRSGIISLPGSRGPYFYRASKSALNMVMRVLADDLRDTGVIVALVSPPPTETDMLRALVGPQAAARQARPEAAVAGLVKVIAGLTAENSGNQPVYFDGSLLPW